MYNVDEDEEEKSRYRFLVLVEFSRRGLVNVAHKLRQQQKEACCVRHWMRQHMDTRPLVLSVLFSARTASLAVSFVCGVDVPLPFAFSFA